MKDILKGSLEEFISNSSESGDPTLLNKTISLGFVVDNDDPLQQGRLRVFCPAYNDDPKKLLHLPWCAYVSPVGGVISQTGYARGHVEGNESSDGPVHYGFWAIPEIGAHALVACINGDARRRVWLGCIPSHQETHTQGHGRFKHSNGEVDGPLTSTGNPIEPTSTKLKQAFNGEISSSEWKTRGADYQITSVTERPSPEKSLYTDDNLDTIVDNEEDEWVKEILGEHGYDWTGYKNLGAFLASKVYGWTTPGFHSFTMDDRPFNSRMRFRTAGGNQIILDDTNERIYFSTSEGKSWIEMDAAGNVDLYAERRLSIHSEKDLNFSAGESIRFKAKKFISMYAGDGVPLGQTSLTEVLSDGEIRIHSSSDLHLKVDGTLQSNINGDFLMSVGGETGGETNLTFNGDVNIGVEGSFGISALNNIDFSSADVTFTIAGKGTTINTLTEFLDSFVDTYNEHSHVGAGVNLNLNDPIDLPDPVTIDVQIDLTQIAPWTNRVPEHEPWPRVLKQDSDDDVNSENNSYLNNVDWINQFDNVGEEGRKPIGKVEGDETIERGRFWRR